MKLIDISTKNYPDTFVVVDDDDFDDLSKFKWHKSRAGYAVRSIRKPKSKCIYMHRALLGNPKSEIDHINGNPLDNRRSNLRLATRQQNAANTKCKSRCGLKGVTYHPQTGKWRARIMLNYKQIHIGLYLTPEKANTAYAQKAKEIFGNYSKS